MTILGNLVPKRNLRARLHTGAAAWACALIVPALGYTAPEGGVVAHGGASIAQSGSVTTVTQGTDRAVIDWQKFNLGTQESAHFLQPGVGSVTVNRIHDVNPSSIQGTLTANGNVVLINPNGVLFGPTAKVDVQGLVASTARPTEADAKAWAEGLRRDLPLSVAGDKNAMIYNAGTITAKEAGLIGFVAPTVANDGILRASKGRVHLASGDTATLDLQGDGLVNIAVSDDTAHQLVNQRGLIQADGGTVLLTAAAGQHVTNGIINMEGVIQARSIDNVNGRILLSAEGSNAVAGNAAADKGKKAGNSLVVVSGVLDASGRAAGQKGGHITVTGDNVALTGTAFLDASGDTGKSGTTTGQAKSASRRYAQDEGSAGGEILIGGDYLGTGSTPNALNVYVDSGALILNDAITRGDAGRTIVWSDHDTAFYGTVLARALGGLGTDPVTGSAIAGGALAYGNPGDGGFVETSGHHHLDAGGYVDLTASNPLSARGTYFLDPTNITIYGNVDPNFVSTDGTSINLASSLKLWLDASDKSKVLLTYNPLGTTATGTSGSNTITVSANTSLTVGARIRLGASGSVTAASTLGADTYTITAISGTTVTLSNNLTTNYSGSALYQGYVSQLNDKSSAGGNVLQGTVSKMPLWIENGQNNMSQIQFNGAQGLVGSYASMPTFTNYTFFNTFQSTSPTSGQVFFYLGNTGANGFGSAYFSSRASLLYGGNVVKDVGTVSSAYQIIKSNYNGSLSTFNVNGAGQTVTSPGTAYNSPSNIISVGTQDNQTANFMQGIISDVILYNSTISADAEALINQYESAKWGIALSPSGTGATEAAKAMASDGYSVFTTRYLERLSQTADISLQASNNINLDFKGDAITLANDRNFTLTAGNGIFTVAGSNGGITTNRTGTGGNIAFVAGAGGINLSNFSLNANNGANISLSAGTAGVTLSNVSFNTNNGGGVSLTSTGGGTNNVSTTNSAINIYGPLTLSGNTTLNAGTGTITLGVVNAGSSSLTLQSDDVVLNGDLTGTGNLTLSPTTDGRNMRINWYNGEYDVDAAEIAHIKDGWNNITLGNATVGGITLGDTSWTDNVSFVKKTGGFGNISNNGILTLTGGAAASFTSAYVDFYNSVTTNGGGVTVNGVTTNYNGSVITTSGGAVNLNGDVRVNASGTALNVSSGGGAINLTGPVYEINGSTAGKYVVLNAGSGIVTLGNTVNGGFGLTTTGSSTVFSNAVGNSTALGAITVNGASTINNNISTNNAAMNFTGAIALGGNAIVNAGTSTITTGSTIAAGTRDLTLTADDLILGGNLSGTGILTLQPSSAAKVMNINNGAGGFNLNTTELGYLVDGWGLINIGSTSSTAYSNVGASTWKDPVSFRGTYALGVKGLLTGTGDASFTFNQGYTDLFDGITTAGGSINFIGSPGSSVKVTGKTLQTNGGTINYRQIYGNGQSIALDAGNGTLNFLSAITDLSSITATAGNLTFNGSWGSTGSLGTVSLTSAGNLALPSITSTNLYLDSTGTVTQTGAITATNLALAGTGGIYTLNNASNAITTLAANTGTVNFTEGSGYDIGLVNGITGLTATNAYLYMPAGLVTQSQALHTTNLLLDTGGAATGAFNLTHAGNTLTTLANSGTGGIQINGNGYDIGTVNGVNGLTGYYAYLFSTGGTVTQSQKITETIFDMRGATATFNLNNAANNLFYVGGVADTISLTNSTGIYIYNGLGTGIVANNAYLTTHGAVNQAQSINVGNLLLAGTSSSYNLDNTGNIVGQLAAIDTNGVNLVSDGVNIGTVNGVAGLSAPSVSVILNSTGGAVTQSQAINSYALNLLGTGSAYTLNNPANTTTYFGANLAGRTFDYAASSGFSIYSAGGYGITAANGYLSSGGTVTQLETINVGNLLLKGTGTYNLTNTGNAINTLASTAGTVNFLENSGFDIGNVNGVNGLNSTNVYLSSTGTVTQSQKIAATNLLLSGTNGVYSLTNTGNAITTLAANTGTVNFLENSGFDIGIVNGTQGLNATNAYLSTTGTVTESDRIIATNLLLSGTGGIYNLYSGSNDWTTIASSAGVHLLSLIDANGYDIGTVNGVSGLNADIVGLNAAFGSTITQSQAITATGLDIESSSGGVVALTHANNAITTLAATGNSTVSLVENSGFDIGTVFNTGVTASDVYLSSTGTITQSQKLVANNLLLYGTGGTYNLTNSANNVGTLAGSTGSVNLFNGNNSLTVGTVYGLSGLTTTAGNSSLDTGTGTLTVSQAVDAGAHDLSITGDDVNLNAAISGTGTLTLQPSSTNRVVRINDAAGDFNLSNAEIGLLSDGWSQINLGRLNQATDTWIQGTVTFKDPVTIRSGNHIGNYANLIGTGDASFTFAGAGWMDMGLATITTQNQKVDFSGLTRANNAGLPGSILSYDGNTITTNGGQVLLNSLAIVSNDFIVNTNGGNITTGQIAMPGWVTNPNTTIGFNAGNGTLAFTDTVNGNYNITGTAGSLTFGSPWGGNNALSNISLTSANTNINLQNIIAAGNVSVNAGTGTIGTGSIAVGAHNLTLTADDLTIGGNLSGTGTLTLQPSSANRIVRVNAGAGDFNLSTAELLQLQNGWNEIILGRATNGASVYSGAMTFRDDLRVRTADDWLLNGQLTLTDGANLNHTSGNGATLAADVVTDGGSVDFSAVLFSGGNITTNGGHFSTNALISFGGSDFSVNTAGGNIDLNQLIQFGGAGNNVNFNAGAGTIGFGNTVDGPINLTANAASMTFNGAWGASTPLGAVSLTSAGTLSLPSITASSILARTTSATSDLTIGSGKVLTASGAGTNITLVAARNFINQNGAAALASGSGRWLAYSTDWTGTTGEENLATGFNRYGCTYGGSCPSGVTIPGTGNGLIYSARPTVTVTADTTHATYGNAASGLSNYAYSASGYRTGDTTDILTGTLSGTSNYVAGNDVGTYNIDYASGTVSSAMGYQVTYANSSNALTVDARSLSIALTSTVQKIYDATTTATLALGNYALGTIFGTDDVHLAGYATGSYDTKDHGTGKTVSVSGLSLSGAKAGNYTLAATSLSGAVGEIDTKTISAALQNTASKTYDGTNTATLSGSNYLLTGVIGSEAVGLNNPVSGTYDTKDHGTGKVVSVNGLTLSGADAGNYTLAATSISGAIGTILTKAITASLQNTVSKTYDGTNIATLTGSNYLLTGVIGSEAVGLNNPASGTYNNQHAGTGKIVDVTGLALSGANAGNYTLVSTSVSGAVGTILAKVLTVTGISVLEKVYDGTTSATISGAAPSFSGVVGMDSVSLNTGLLNANFVDAHAGIGKTVNVTGFSLTGADASDYTINSSSFASSSATITPKGLSVTATGGLQKMLGTPDPVFTYNYTGLVGGDTSASFSGALARDHGRGATTYFINQGTLAAYGDYVIDSFTGATFTVFAAPVMTQPVSAPLPPTVEQGRLGQNITQLVQTTSNSNYVVSADQGWANQQSTDTGSGSASSKNGSNGETESTRIKNPDRVTNGNSYYLLQYTPELEQLLKFN